jgi:hypothetical protein
MIEIIWDEPFLRILKKWRKKHPDLSERFQQKISLFFAYQGLRAYFWYIVILASGLFTSMLLYPTIKHKKLVSKYRDSEEGLIRP